MDHDFTPAAELPPLQEHPFYTEGMAQITSGQWQQASRSFQLLQGIYPDNAEVKELLDQVQMRAALAEFQPRHSSRATRRLSSRRFIVGVLMAIMLIIAAYVAYEMWINPLIIQEILLRQATSLRKEADEALQAGDYARAHQALQKLEAISPGNPQTIEALRRVEQVEKLSALYDEAKALMTAGSWDRASEVLTELQSLDPQYRDLPQLLQIAQESQAMEKQFQAAEEAFASNDWATAIAQYEDIREANLTFRFEEVQARLFESHLKYGQMLLGEAGTDPNLVAEALVHFSEALKLRPVDAEALNERRLAETYLAALNSDDQDQVIDLLQTVYNEQPGYAGKEAAQLLYTNLLERADASLESGDEAAAAADYQVAAQLLVEDPSQAQEKLSELASEMTPE
jgi:outer membrane protein assembly factor BamD (BamD/ComL family)